MKYIERAKIGRTITGRRQLLEMDMKYSLADVFVIKKAKCFKRKVAGWNKFIVQ